MDMKELQKRWEQITNRLSERERKIYKTETLRRILEETERYQGSCGTCKRTLEDYPKYLTLLEEAVQNKGKGRNYLLLVAQMQKHFHKAHGFIAEGMYMGMGVALGLCFGAAFSTIINNFAFVGIGLPIGIGIGIALDQNAKKKGKVI